MAFPSIFLGFRASFGDDFAEKFFDISSIGRVLLDLYTGRAYSMEWTCDFSRDFMYDWSGEIFVGEFSDLTGFRRIVLDF